MLWRRCDRAAALRLAQPSLLCSSVYFSVLQCTTVYYRVLPCTTVYFIQCTSVRFSVLQCTTVWVSQCTSVYFSVNNLFVIVHLVDGMQYYYYIWVCGMQRVSQRFQTQSDYMRTDVDLCRFEILHTSPSCDIHDPAGVPSLSRPPWALKYSRPTTIPHQTALGLHRHRVWSYTAEMSAFVVNIFVSVLPPW